MEGPRGHRGTHREPAIVNLAAGDDSDGDSNRVYPAGGNVAGPDPCHCIAAVREFGRYRAWSRTTARTGLPETLEALLHAVHAHRNAIDERERFRVLGQDAREHAANGQDDG